MLPAYYDQNGQLVAANTTAARTLSGTPIRLVSPAPMAMVGQTQPGFYMSIPVVHTHILTKKIFFL